MRLPRLGADQSGQSIALYAITLLLLSFITMFTISVGVRVREKIKLQAAADASAYGLAVAQARTMNVMAWSNRAIVSEYVSALAVVSHESYLNFWEGLVQAQGTQFSQNEGEYAIQVPPCVDGCTCCCQAAVSAAKAGQIKNMWKNIYNEIHQIWHVDGESLHAALHMLDVQYIVSAKTIVTNGKTAYNNYVDMAQNQTFADGNAKAIDTRMGKMGTSQANFNNFEDSVEYHSDPADWDSYHEILAGTRTDWINNIKSYDPWAASPWWLDGLGQQMEIASGCEGTAITPQPSAHGGAMTSKYHTASDVVAVNQGTTHEYQSGTAKGEGGRVALTAIAWGSTSVTMICEACEPVTYGSKSTSPSQDYRIEDPKGCYTDSMVNAYDGYSDGDSSSSAAHIWTDANGVAQISANCQEEGISEGFFRFKINGYDSRAGGMGPDSSNTTAQNDLWNQPYAYAKLQMNVADGGKLPWDIDIGSFSGSLLALDASKAGASGGTMKDTAQQEENGTNTADVSLSGKGFDNVVYGNMESFSTALSYYHNPDHWAEVPNLWNPFWRAKLEDPTNSKGDTSKGRNTARYATQDLTGDDLAVAQAMGYGDGSGP